MRDRLARLAGKIVADGQPVELVLPATRRVMIERVRQLLGVREARLASEDDLQLYFPDCEVGATQCRKPKAGKSGKS